MRIKKPAKYLIYLALIWFVIHSTIIIIDGLIDNKRKADIVVILGTKVNEDGSLSPRLIKRLECGLNICNSGRVKRIIVSGGLGKEGFYEGDKMKDFLVEKGISDSIIIVDNMGDNTRLTVLNTLKTKDSLHFKSIIVVSQYFHISRIKMLFRKAGFQNVNSASPRYFEMLDFYSLVREFFAFYSQL